MKFFKLTLKCTIISALLFLTTQLTAQTVNTEYATKINTAFSGIDKTKVPHHLLVDYAMEFAELSAFNGTLNSTNFLHKGHYTGIYNTLLMARTQTSVPGLVNPDTFKTNWDNLRQPNKIVLSGLYYTYSKIKSNANPNYLTVSNNKYYDKYTNGVWQNPYETHQVFAVSAPILKYNKLSVVVELPNTLWYTNQAAQVQSIAINFNDGNGYQTMTFNQLKTITYSQAGVYEWIYKLTLTNNQVLYSHSKIQVEGTAPAPPQNTANRTIFEPCAVNAFGIDQVEFVGTQTYLGLANTATIEIDYRAGSNCVITRPLIVAEGFDSGLLGVENPLGENDYFNFIGEAFDNTGALAGEITDYDIIYINWDNSKDFLQRNALLLEDIITWVNSEKTGNTPNVVLGQSMGGVIARYALADMEDNPSLNHNTSLFVSHDAPHQGANIPLSVQYFARHLIDQFVSTPVGNININPNDNGFVSIRDIEDLLDAPGTRQLLSNNIDSGFSVNNILFDTWQSELQLIGYPTLTKNIAISNGNHCANSQDFNPNDTLFSINGDGKTSVLTDIVSILLGPITNVTYVGLAFTFDELGLILGVLPGTSEFDLDFNGKALPPAGWNRQIYRGKITFTKKLLWLIDIDVTLTEREHNNPPNILSYDYYPGGFYQSILDFPNTSFSNVLASANINATIRERFNFIPTPSALDIGEGNVTLNNDDYFVKYNAANPPLAPKHTPFVNFTTSYQINSTLNEEHISFNPRNGDWLALELDNNVATEDIFNCSFICDNGDIIGFDRVCTGSTNYTAPLGGDTYQWTIFGSAATITSGTNANTITIARNGTNSGWVTLNVQITSVRCGINANSPIVLEKQIYIGTPLVESVTEVQLTTTGLTSPIAPIDSCDDIGLQLNIAPSNQEVTDVEWQKVTTNYQWTHGNDEYVIIKPTCNGIIKFNVRAKSSCGWSPWQEVVYNVTNCNNNCTNGSGSISSNDFLIYSVPATTTLTVKLKNEPIGLLQNGDTLNIKIYNNFGWLVYNYDAIATQTAIDVSSYNQGIYTLALTYNGQPESHQISIN